MHVPFSRFTGAMFIRPYRMNCQVVDTGSNCLRVQTRRGVVAGAAGNLEL